MARHTKSREQAFPTPHKNAKKKTATKKAAPKKVREDKRESPADFETSAAPRNLDGDTKGKSTHALEATEPGKRPSRKSSRGGANRVKPDAQKQRQTTRAVRSPKARNASRSG